MPYLLAALGGAVGALARWALAAALPGSSGGWPWSTLVVNLLGCLLLGALLGTLAARAVEPAWARPFVAVGVLGGFTTYSAFALEVVALGEAGRVGAAAGYVTASVLGGVLAVAAGAAWARARAAGPVR
jgi:CrcB protein